MHRNCCGVLLSWQSDCKCRHANRHEVNKRQLWNIVYFLKGLIIRLNEMSRLDDGATPQTAVLSLLSCF